MTPTSGGIKGTSQMVAADADGNLAALCTSLETGFGSLVLVPGTGVFLNNAMQNFDARPGRPNSIAPGKMPIFGVPTIVATENGRPRLAIGGSGGYRMLTAVVHPLVHAVDFGMGIQAGVDAPRVHCQGGTTEVDDRIPPSVRERLSAMGHEVEPRNSTRAGLAFGRVCAILVDPRTGQLHGGSGPADLTAAAGW